MLTSFQQHVPHKHFGGEITSRAIAGRRCYRTRMYEVTWSNHNLTLFPIKPHISGTGGFTVRALCKLHSSFSNQNTLIKIPACKPVRARRRRPASLTLAFTLFWGRAQAQRRRGRSCAQACFESGHSGMMQAQSGDNRWQHLQPSHRQSLCESGAFPSSTSILLFFLSELLSHTETMKQSVCSSHVILPCLKVRADYKLILGLILCMCVQKRNTRRPNTKTSEHNERVTDWVRRPWRETASFWGLWVIGCSWTSWRWERISFSRLSNCLQMNTRQKNERNVSHGNTIKT